MSIWNSLDIDDPDEISGLDYEDDDASYRGLGETTIAVDIATARSYHPFARVSLMPAGGDVDLALEQRLDQAAVLLSPRQLRRLAARATRAAEFLEDVYGAEPTLDTDRVWVATWPPQKGGDRQ